MDAKYHIEDGCIYFNYKFNKPLDNYTHVMKNCTQIIFLNYDDYTSYNETENKYNYKYHYNYKYNKFNCPLENSLVHQTQLPQLVFGTMFNQPLDNLTLLEQLTFGD